MVHPQIWVLDNTGLNNGWITEETTRKIREYFKRDENENSLWNFGIQWKTADTEEENSNDLTLNCKKLGRQSKQKLKYTLIKTS